MPGTSAGRAEPALTSAGDTHAEPPPLLIRGLAGRAWTAVQSLVGVGILAALAAHLGAEPFIDGLRAVGAGSVLAALGIGVMTTVFSAWRWCLVARSLGLRLPLGRAVSECYRALFLNSVLPAGVLGDVNRAVVHGRRAGDLRRSVRAVVVERLCGHVVLIVFAAAVLLARPAVLVAIRDRLRMTPPVQAPTPVQAPPAAGLPPAVVVPAAALGVAILLTAVVLVTRRAARGNTVRNSLGGARKPGRPSTREHGRLVLGVAVAALSAGALLGYLTMFVIAARAAGSHAAVPDLLPVLVLALLAMGLPLSIGGWGPREAVTTAAFAAVGLGAAEGLTVAVVYGTLSFVACLPGAGVLLMGVRRRHEGAVVAC